MPPSPRHRVVCPYCGAFAQKVQDRWGWKFVCEDCDASVGCHPDGRPMGTLANRELRGARIAAHAAFDPLWEAAIRLRGWSKKRARVTAYVWLAARLEMPYESCHIGMFDVETCERVVRVCQRPRKDPSC